MTCRPPSASASVTQIEPSARSRLAIHAGRGLVPAPVVMAPTTRLIRGLEHPDLLVRTRLPPVELARRAVDAADLQDVSHRKYLTLVVLQVVDQLLALVAIHLGVDCGDQDVELAI